MKRKLQEIFGYDKDLFLAYINKRVEGYSIRLGYDTPNDLWDSNPDVEFN